MPIMGCGAAFLCPWPCGLPSKLHKPSQCWRTFPSCWPASWVATPYSWLGKSSSSPTAASLAPSNNWSRTSFTTFSKEPLPKRPGWKEVLKLCSKSNGQSQTECPSSLPSTSFYYQSPWPSSKSRFPSSSWPPPPSTSSWPCYHRCLKHFHRVLALVRELWLCKPFSSYSLKVCRPWC